MCPGPVAGRSSLTLHVTVRPVAGCSSLALHVAACPVAFSQLCVPLDVLSLRFTAVSMDTFVVREKAETV